MKVTGNLPGERRDFTIKASGKAFRILIDGLYEDKALAVVRELCTNAYDAHVAAGNADTPFDVQLPSWGEQTLRIRDYGIGMTHDQVMDLYTTIFDSTKTETNEQVGQFGLGSKSPFAITTSFSVTCYLDGECRVYVASMDETGVPTLTHLSTVPSDEPRGTEVTVPVGSMNVKQFVTAYEKVALGFETMPNVLGQAVTIPEPMLSGDGWRVYPSTVMNPSAYPSGSQRRPYVRQGCVVYNVSNVSLPDMPLGGTFIVDVPVGSCDVAASREVLQLDDETVKTVQGVYRLLPVEIEKAVNERIADATSYLDACRKFVTIARDLGYRRRGVWQGRELVDSIRIPTTMPNPDYDDKDPGSVPTLPIELTVGSFRRGSTGKQIQAGAISVHHTTAVKIAVPARNTGKRLVRSKQRLRNWQAQNPSAHLYCEHPERLGEVITLLELDPRTVFVPLDTLPDCPPPKRTSTGPKVTRPKVEAPKGYWMPRNRDTPVVSGVQYNRDFWTQSRLRSIAQFLSGDLATEVTFLTEVQVSKLNPAPENNVVTALLAWLKDNETTMRQEIAVRNYVPDAMQSMVRTQLGLKGDAPKPADVNTVMNALPYVYGYWENNKAAEKVTALVQAHRKMLAKRYPLLDPDYSDLTEAELAAAQVQYVEMIDGKDNR